MWPMRARRRLGRIVNHDPRSRAFPAPSAVVRRTVLHPLQGPILNQGALGGCTGFAAAHAMNTGPMRRPSRPLLGFDDAVALYSLATTKDKIAGTYPPTDCGSSGLGVAKALREKGLITAYRHAFGLDHCLDALTLSPVLIGTNWYTSMYKVDTDGFLNVSGDVVGGHEWCAIGVDVQGEFIWAVNSWGSRWANDGMFKVRWSDLDRLLHEDGDVTVLQP